MKVNRKKFFDGFKKHFDSSLDQAQVDGIEFLLTSFEAEPLWKDVRHIAYALATIYHETAASMQPVEEGYYLGSPTRVKNFQKTLRYYPHFGRGYVQLTWERNYVKAGKALGVDFVKNPKLVMRPDYSFQILTRGMFEGWFTGKKLSTYIHGTVCDYVNARKIINGTDKAGLIAGYARLFEKLLRDSGSSTTAAVQTADSSSLESESINASTTPTNIETTTVEVENGSVVSTTTTTQEEAEIEGVKPYNGKGLGGTLKDDAKAILPANFGLGVLSEWLQQTAGLPEWVAQLLPKLVIVLLVCTALWLLYRVITWAKHTWVENERVKLLAIINSDKSRKDIVLK